MHQRDLRAEHRILAHEGLRPVDRVDQPEVLRIAALRARLLAEKPVLGEPRGKDGADDALAFDIRLRHRGFVRLHLHREVALVERADDPRSGFGGLEGCGQPGGRRRR